MENSHLRLGQLDDRIADELAGTVPGDLAAAVHVDDRRSRIAGRPVGRCRPLPGRVHRLVLEQQAAVRGLAGHAPGVHAPLQFPGLAVLHASGAEVKVDKLTHFSQLTPGRPKGWPVSAQRAPAPRAARPQSAGGQ